MNAIREATGIWQFLGTSAKENSDETNSVNNQIPAQPPGPQYVLVGEEKVSDLVIEV